MDENRFRLSGTAPNLVNQYGITLHVISGNRKSDNFNLALTIIDSTPPKLNLLGDKIITLRQGSPYLEPGYFAEDKYGNDLTEQVSVTPELNQDLVHNMLHYLVVDLSLIHI